MSLDALIARDSDEEYEQGYEDALDYIPFSPPEYGSVACYTAYVTGYLDGRDDIEWGWS